ncbi:hypothetical protein AVEN_225657-1 [Araneus ventricosus]|uniref:Uncharacterized protein n=1 Tax=Araneus ventricosus TaxID=182803 RepID=A0A4Y2TWL1_ARAVE|nr:hypothetical protein AVEN_225657-1 [Araneus ventricosus]
MRLHFTLRTALRAIPCPHGLSHRRNARHFLQAPRALARETPLSSPQLYCILLSSKPKPLCLPLKLPVPKKTPLWRLRKSKLCQNYVLSVAINIATLKTDDRHIPEKKPKRVKTQRIPVQKVSSRVAGETEFCNAPAQRVIGGLVFPGNSSLAKVNKLLEMLAWEEKKSSPQEKKTSRNKNEKKFA